VSRYPCLSPKRQLKKQEKKEEKYRSTWFHDRTWCNAETLGRGSKEREKGRREKEKRFYVDLSGSLRPLWRREEEPELCC
jgi:hypothetical protein